MDFSTLVKIDSLIGAGGFVGVAIVLTVAFWVSSLSGYRKASAAFMLGFVCWFFLTSVLHLIVSREAREYRALVMADVANEYGLSMDGVKRISCIAGLWHYSVESWGDNWHQFSLPASCKDDRGIEARFNEKWPY